METIQSHTNNITNDPFLAKPAQTELQLNSQGERIEAPVSAPGEALVENSTLPQPKQAAIPQWECSYEDISLGDTPLAGPLDLLFPPTDDSGLEHAIISCGHVLKSTHDLARWSEKTGARRVNGPESIDSVSDLIISLEAPKTQPQPQQQQQKKSGDLNLSFLFGGKNDNKTGGSKTRSDNGSWFQKQPSKVISCGPVLKSTHDAATWSEKSGANAVNSAASAGLLDELAGGEGQMKRSSSGRRLNKPKQLSQNSASSQGTAKTGGSLQSGLDTQAGSHIQLDGSKAKESPEKAMQELHLHV